MQRRGAALVAPRASAQSAPSQFSMWASVSSAIASYGRCRDTAIPAGGEIDELYLQPEYQGLGFGSSPVPRRTQLISATGSRARFWSGPLAENAADVISMKPWVGAASPGPTSRIGDSALTKIAYLFD